MEKSIYGVLIASVVLIIILILLTLLNIIPITLIGLTIPVVALLTAIVSWYLNESSKREYEEYKRREDRYIGLIKNLSGFYGQTPDQGKMTEFLYQANLCWLYCPDNVIHKLNAFLKAFSDKYNDEESKRKEREKALQELMISIREDLLSRKALKKKTELNADDYKPMVPD